MWRFSQFTRARKAKAKQRRKMMILQLRSKSSIWHESYTRRGWRNLRREQAMERLLVIRR